jgi:hypothetical protein
MRGRALIVGGSGLIVVGLIVLGPAIWLMLDQMFQQVFGAPLIGIIIGGGGLIVPLILTALGTAAVVGGAWMIANGSRQRREKIKSSDKMPKPADKPMDRTSIGGMR